MKIYCENQTGYIQGLNGLRFFAALSVIFLHLGSEQFLKNSHLEVIFPLVSGNTGVILFYVISGFLITSLAIDEVRFFKNFHLLQFLQRRAIRLFPLYYFALFFLFVLDLWDLLGIRSKSWYYAFFYAYNYIPKNDYHGLMGSFHTLATEEQFYILYGIFLFLIFRKKTVRIAFFVAPMVLLSLAVFNNSIANILNIQAYAQTHYVDRWLIQAIDPILIGCVAAFICRSSMVFRFIPTLSQSRFLFYFIFYGLFGLGSFLIIGFVFFHRSIELLSVGFSLILIHFYFFRFTLFVKCLEWRPLCYLGKISYGLYVWQSVFNGTGTHSRWLPSPVHSTILVFVVSILTYEFIEKKCLKFKMTPLAKK